MRAQTIAFVSSDGEYSGWAKKGADFKSFFVAGKPEANPGLDEKFSYIYKGQNIYESLHTMLKNQGAI